MRSSLLHHSVGVSRGPAPIFFDRLAPAARTELPTIVMIPGGGHNGSCYLRTVDDRPGWAYRLVEHGFPTVVLDWPGHGRSGTVPLERLNGELIVQSIAALIDELDGPTVLLTHSMSGAFGWRVLELRAAAVVALVGIAPAPPGNIQPEAAILEESADAVVLQTAFRTMSFRLDRYGTQPREFVEEKLIGTSRRFPRDRIDAYAATLTAMAPRLRYERQNPRGAQLRVHDTTQLAGKPILVVTGSEDLEHPRALDAATVAWLREQGAQAEHVWLADHGLSGHGHMLMLEEGNDEIADLIAARLTRAVATDSRPNAPTSVAAHGEEVYRR